jgi:hypothetical protein
MKLKTIALAAMATAVATVAQAQGFVGTIGLLDIGTPSASPGPDFNGATSYTIGNLASFTDTTGVFTSLTDQDYGPVSFSLANGNSLSFSSPEFGTFSSTSITVETSVEGFVGLHILGDYTSGTFDGGAIVDDPASFDLSFTQNPPGSGGAIDSGVFSIPPSVVPEPSTTALMVVGAAGALCKYLRRRKA